MAFNILTNIAFY